MPRTAHLVEADVAHDLAADYAALDRATVSRRAEAAQDQLDGVVRIIRDSLLVRAGKVIDLDLATERAGNIAMILDLDPGLGAGESVSTKAVMKAAMIADITPRLAALRLKVAGSTSPSLHDVERVVDLEKALAAAERWVLS